MRSRGLITVRLNFYIISGSVQCQLASFLTCWKGASVSRLCPDPPSPAPWHAPVLASTVTGARAHSCVSRVKWWSHNFNAHFLPAEEELSCFLDTLKSNSHGNYKTKLTLLYSGSWTVSLQLSEVTCEHFRVTLTWGRRGLYPYRFSLEVHIHLLHVRVRVSVHRPPVDVIPKTSVRQQKHGHLQKEKKSEAHLQNSKPSFC